MPLRRSARPATESPFRNGFGTPTIMGVVRYRRGSRQFYLATPSWRRTVLLRGRGPLASEPARSTDGQQASQNNTEGTEKARRPRRSEDSGASRGAGSDSRAKRQNLASPWPPCLLRALRVILACLLAVGRAHWLPRQRASTTEATMCDGRMARPGGEGGELRRAPAISNDAHDHRRVEAVSRRTLSGNRQNM